MTERVDNRNAHIRDAVPGATQSSPGREAADALEHPAIKKAFADVRESIIQQIERFPIDGDAETEREMCRYLRNVANVKRVLTIAVQGQTLREHDFRPIAPPEKKKA